MNLYFCNSCDESSHFLYWWLCDQTVCHNLHSTWKDVWIWVWPISRKLNFERFQSRWHRWSFSHLFYFVQWLGFFIVIWSLLLASSSSELITTSHEFFYHPTKSIHQAFAAMYLVIIQLDVLAAVYVFLSNHLYIKAQLRITKHYQMLKLNDQVIIMLSKFYTIYGKWKSRTLQPPTFCHCIK